MAIKKPHRTFIPLPYSLLALESELCKDRDFIHCVRLLLFMWHLQQYLAQSRHSVNSCCWKIVIPISEVENEGQLKARQLVRFRTSLMMSRAEFPSLQHTTSHLGKGQKIYIFLKNDVKLLIWLFIKMNQDAHTWGQFRCLLDPGDVTEIEIKFA